MNEKALRATVGKIQAAVQRPRNFFSMSWWVEKVYDRDHAECGTAACFAGWAVDAKTRAVGYGIRSAAQKKLGLTEDQTHRLFAADAWPMGYRQAYYTAARHANKLRPGTKARTKAELAKVKVLRERVEHFIATGE
jgi:hypothetical protein